MQSSLGHMDAVFTGSQGRSLYRVTGTQSLPSHRNAVYTGNASVLQCTTLAYCSALHWRTAWTHHTTALTCFSLYMRRKKLFAICQITSLRHSICVFIKFIKYVNKYVWILRCNWLFSAASFGPYFHEYEIIWTDLPIFRTLKFRDAKDKASLT